MGSTGQAALDSRPGSDGDDRPSRINNFVFGRGLFYRPELRPARAFDFTEYKLAYNKPELSGAQSRDELPLGRRGGLVALFFSGPLVWKHGWQTNELHAGKYYVSCACTHARYDLALSLLRAFGQSPDAAPNFNPEGLIRQLEVDERAVQSRVGRALNVEELAVVFWTSAKDSAGERFFLLVNRALRADAAGDMLNCTVRLLNAI